MKPFTYESLPGRVVFGPGRVTEVRAEVEALDRSRVFLIADGAAKALGDAVAEQLGDLVVQRWDEVVQHVPVELADRARAAATEAGADVAVCLGGGSSTGLAKALALQPRAAHRGRADHVRGQRDDADLRADRRAPQADRQGPRSCCPRSSSTTRSSPSACPPA